MTWKDAITSQTTSFQQAVKDATSPDDIKVALDGFLTTVVEDTDTMVAAIEAMGAPDVQGGAEAHATLTGALGNIQTLFQAALDDVKTLDTSSNPQGLAKALQGIGQDLQTGSADAQNALGGTSNAELDAAFKDSPSCTALQR